MGTGRKKENEGFRKSEHASALQANQSGSIAELSILSKGEGAMELREIFFMSTDKESDGPKKKTPVGTQGSKMISGNGKPSMGIERARPCKTKASVQGVEAGGAPKIR